MNPPEKPNKSLLADILGPAAELLDRAVRAVPAARYFWGVVAASATVAIISFLNKLTWLTFVSIVAAFIAMVLFFVFSRFEKSSDVVVRLIGHVLLIATGAAFTFVIATSMSLALTCKPPLMAYLYGVSEFCEKKTGSVLEIA